MESISLTTWTRPVKLIFVIETEEQLIKSIEYCTIVWGGIFNEIYLKEELPSLQTLQFDYLVRFNKDDVNQENDYESIEIHYEELLKSNFQSKKKYPKYIDILPILSMSDIKSLPLCLNKVDNLVSHFRFGKTPQFTGYNYDKILEENFETQEIHKSVSPFESRNIKDQFETPLEITGANLYLVGRSFSHNLKKILFYIGDEKDYKQITRLWTIRTYGYAIEIISEKDLKTLNKFEDYIKTRQESIEADKMSIHCCRDNHWSILEKQSEYLSLYKVENVLSLAKYDNLDPPYVLQTENEHAIAHLDGKRLQFKHILPNYLSNHFTHNKHQHIGICIEHPKLYNLDNYSFVQSIPKLPNIERLLLNSSPVMDNVRIHGQTITSFSESYGFTESHYFNSYYDLIRSFILSNGFDIQLSPGGRNLQTIVQNYGGIDPGCRIFKATPVRMLLFELEENKEISLVKAKQIVSRNWSDKEISSGLRHLNKQNLLDILCKRNILRFGYDLACEHCNNSGWYPISNITKEWTCSFCEKVNLTGIPPLNSQSFKSNGIFQIKGGSNGAMTNLLVIWRFFHRSLSDRSNYLPSFEVINKDTKEQIVECDALITTRKNYKSSSHLILVEGKTVQDLQVKDMESMKKLLEIFGVQSFVCFATLKDKFSDVEKELIEKFKLDHSRLILLASDELKYYEMSQAIEDPRDGRYIGDLEVFAEATQKKYLNSEE
jgi:hypothetical protein